MECCILRKVPYRLPGTSRLVWAVILAEREGLSLLFVQRPDDKRSHTIAIATENVAERVFEDVNASRFHLEQDDLVEVGNKLRALGEGFSAEEFNRFFKSEDLW
jgi:hypothetical protein